MRECNFQRLKGYTGAHRGSVNAVHEIELLSMGVLGSHSLCQLMLTLTICAYLHLLIPAHTICTYSCLFCPLIPTIILYLLLPSTTGLGFVRQSK